MKNYPALSDSKPPLSETFRCPFWLAIIWMSKKCSFVKWSSPHPKNLSGPGWQCTIYYVTHPFCFNFQTSLGWPAVSGIQSQLFFWTIRQSAWCIAFDFLIWAACGSLGIKLGSMVYLICKWKFERKNTEIPEWWLLHSLSIVVLLTRFLNCRDFFHSLPS